MTTQVFNSSGTFTPPAGVTSVDVLIVAGGGGGGQASTSSYGTGGGGAGGLRWLTGVSVTPGVGVTVTVGAGGNKGSNSNGSSGGSSAFGGLTAVGGGGGAGGSATANPGLAGGSGGGGSSSSASIGPGGAGTAGQGNDGGQSFGISTGSTKAGGGGGGAGSVGSAGASNVGGDGGDGLDMSAYVGTSVGVSGWFAGGGGGRSGSGGLGGQGGGGASGAPASAGAANTGGGGGAARGSGVAGNGGSGVVIVVYSSGGATVSGTQAIETDTAQAGSVVAGQRINGAQAVETDTARAGVLSGPVVIVGGRALEGDEAVAGTLSSVTVLVGGQAVETDEVPAGGALGDLTLIVGGQAVEVDIARPGAIDFGYAATDTRNRAGGRARGGYAVATWDPPVADPPPTLVFGEARDRANAFGSVTMQGAQPVYDVTTETRARHRTRILVGGKDVTYFRSIPTPIPSYQLVSPLLYGPATLRFPQMAAWAENPPTWLKVEKAVKVQRVDENGDVVATDYKGVVIAFNRAGADLTVEIGGEASGRAALMERPLPIFRKTFDIGHYAYGAIRELGLPFSPRGGPTTGITLARFGGTGFLDYISQLCARAWTRSGNQWTIVPVDGRYRMQRKDTTTIHGTAYLDDARTVGDLRRDKAEEPNRIYLTGITPNGQRVRFGVYPGLKQGRPPAYPFNNDRNFGVGTTDAETDTGDGVTVMIKQLMVAKFLDGEDMPGGYESDVAAAIRELQDVAGLSVTGTMTPNTWRALYDLDATGFSLRMSHVEPAAQRVYTKQWIRSGSGAIIRRNPAFEPLRLKVDRTVDLGSGFTIPQMREYAQTMIADGADENWVGTITFHTGALVNGDHTPGDPIDSVRRARSLQPGMNIKAVWKEGETVLHVSGISVGEDGTVTATVDTRARDSMAVWEVIQRNRESRRDPARQWVRDHRASGQIKDAIDGWDEVGGLLGSKVDVPAHTWTTFEVVAGQEGTVQRLLLDTAPNAEFVCAVFGTKIPAKRLARLVGNPLDITAHVSSIEVTDGGESYESSPDVVIDGGGGSGATAHAVISGGKVVRVNVTNRGGGYTSVPSVSFTGGGGSGAYAEANVSGTGSERWADPQIRRDLDDHLMLYGAGSAEEPCGYFPRRKQGDHPLTGRWKDDAGFAYYTFTQPVLYVAVYADRDTSIPAGRIMWPQLEAGA